MRRHPRSRTVWAVGKTPKRGAVNTSRTHSTAGNPPDASGGFFELTANSHVDSDIEATVARARARGASGNASALSAFQRSMERFPPLDSDQQLALVATHRENASRIEKLAQANRARDRERLRALRAEQERLIEHLCASCWRLAWLIVREQAEERFGKDRATEMLPDLLGEANYALVKAAHDFDPAMTPKFATYAARVIRDHVRAVLGRDGYMRLAPSWGRVKRLASTRLPEMTHELGRRPTIEELQVDLTKRCLEWAVNHLTDEQKRLPKVQRDKLAMAKLRKQGMLGAIRDIEDILVISQSVVSLDGLVGEDGTSTLGDTLSTPVEHELLDDLEREALREKMMEALALLSDREREIVLLRYGFDGSEGWTYAAIAERYDVSSERIRQIEKGALEKLADPAGTGGSLLGFLRQ